MRSSGVAEYWQRQTQDKPLFPDVLWERPERRDQAGKLLIVGGSTSGIHDVSEAYQAAIEAGVGEARVLVPETLRKLTEHLEKIDFLPATPTGNLSLAAEKDLLFNATQVDGVLIPGNIGRNSESSMLMGRLVRSYTGKLGLTKDAVEAIQNEAKFILGRPETLLVLSFAQLQRLAKQSAWLQSFTSDMDLLLFIDKLHLFSQQIEATLITKHHNQLVAADKGKIISTARPDLNDLWCVNIAARSMVFWLHHPDKTLGALASAMI